MKVNNYFSKEQQKKIVAAIKSAELNTSGEIRVHIEKKCDDDVLERTAWVFEKLNMHKTLYHNGVLIYLALESKKFAIIGDSGINYLIREDFWDKTKEKMQNQFVQQRFTEGIVEAVGEIGLLLKELFPYEQKGHLNELSDEISFGK